MFNRIDEYLENNKSTENDTFLYILSRTLKKLPLILHWQILWRRVFRLTVSNAFFKSMKQAKLYLLFLKYLSIIVCSGKIWSLVLNINDLIDHFGPECEPLELKKKPISCLLYADDIILLSESAKGLQKSLDILKTYCEFWIRFFFPPPKSEYFLNGRSLWQIIYSIWRCTCRLE
jgi:hypothetical protein